MEKLRLGYAALSKASWKTAKISQLMERALGSIRRLPVDLVHAEGLTATEEDAIRLCAEFRRKDVDVLVLHFATFPVGAMIPAMLKAIDVPLILFANPEEPSSDGLWEQNSFCGANMAAHVLEKMKRKRFFAWGRAEDAAESLAPALKVLGCVKELSGARLGLIGGRAPGFYTSNIDEMKLRAILGVSVELIDLLEVVEAAKKIQGKAPDSKERVRKSASGLLCVTENELGLAGSLQQAFSCIAEKYRLDSMAIRCWPELPDIYGIAPCSVIGMLNDMGLTVSCEGDIPGALSMMIQKSLSGGSIPFFADLISFDYNDNTGVLWHCGAAPVSLCRKFSETMLRRHMRVDGGDRKGLTNEFSLKSGRVTLAKLDEGKSAYRMLVATGTALDTDKFMRGNPLRVKFDAPMKRLIDTIMTKGFEHHYSLVHADISNELRSFCEHMDIEQVFVE
ncbi:MAG: hypothetical protein A2X49_15880 [Lentisphaerae bacterium GWF2_52_8]|nr:MAG: hypothetical protein A2X49_15880 [Lentisphaerae bacterium GWF2_52_8]